jgi:hypothetical protein
LDFGYIFIFYGAWAPPSFLGDPQIPKEALKNFDDGSFTFNSQDKLRWLFLFDKSGYTISHLKLRL